jgi:hypothetical protein
MKTSMRFDLVDLRLFLFVVEAASMGAAVKAYPATIAPMSAETEIKGEGRGFTNAHTATITGSRWRRSPA